MIESVQLYFFVFHTLSVDVIYNYYKIKILPKLFDAGSTQTLYLAVSLVPRASFLSAPPLSLQGAVITAVVWTAELLAPFSNIILVSFGQLPVSISELNIESI